MIAELEVKRSDGVQTIRFNRPEKKNALASFIYEAIVEALKTGDASPDIAAHVFLGSGGCFTAGSDINEFLKRATGSPDLGGAVQGFLKLLPRVEKPMIAAVDGLAVGIGTTMLFHCDLVYASPTASLRTPFLNLGIVPEAGSSLLGPMRMGYARAFEMLCLGEAFDAERALQSGLVNAIVPADKLEAHAIAAARKLAAKPPEALAIARRLMRGDPAAVVAQMEKEIALYSERLQSAEAKEAFTAFLEKRPPDFARLRKGRS